MACPVCGDYRGDSVCPRCTRDGYIELGCSCVERPNGTRIACSDRHELCEACGIQARQAGDTICGDCRLLEETDDLSEAREQVALTLLARWSMAR